MNHKVLPDAERLAANLADVRLLAGMYSHVYLQIGLARDGLSTDLASYLILAAVYLQVYLQGSLPIALEVTDIALVLLPLTVRLDVHVQVRGTGVRRITDFTNEGFLPRVSQQMPLQSLIRVKSFAAYLAVRDVLLIVFLLVQS